jgi:hypothetical protein
MTTLKKVPMQLVEVETIPDDLDQGKFYYSEKYKTATHVCPCGCGQAFPIPIKNEEWQITNKVKLTVIPSIHHRIKCQSHYIITDGFANIVNHPIPEKLWSGFKHDTHAPGGCPL